MGYGPDPSIRQDPGVAVDEPVPGSAPARAVEAPRCVDPTGAVRAGALLVRAGGQGEVADRVEGPVDRVRRARGADLLDGRAPTALRAGALVEAAAG